jgi:hypothetical protein
MTDTVRDKIARSLHGEFGRMTQSWARMADDERGSWLKRADRLIAMLATSAEGEGEWITHDGGPNPVPGKMVQVRFEVGGYADKASDDLRWTYDRGGYDIIAYRVTEGVKP